MMSIRAPGGCDADREARNVWRSARRFVRLRSAAVMAIVSRRVLQRLILDNSRFLSLEQRRQHADAINRGRAISLSFEWEILVLNALSTLCRVSHEPELGSSRPDVLAHVEGAEAESFIADIATAFEDSHDKRNPVEELQRLVSDRAFRRHGLSGNGFQIDVRGEREGPRGEQRMQLRLPRRKSILDFFRKHVAPFVDAVGAEPSERRAQEIVTEEANLSISFTPGRPSAGMSFPSYTIAYSLTRNLVFQKVTDKIDQLKRAGFDGPRCVILCGADASLMRRGYGPGFGAQAIAKELFRQHGSLSAILTLSARG